MLRKAWDRRLGQRVWERSASLLCFSTDTASRKAPPSDSTTREKSTSPPKRTATPKKTTKGRTRLSQRKSRQDTQRKTLAKGRPPFGRHLAPDVWTAHNWRMVESLFQRDGVKWKMEEFRIAWKRCVLAHLDTATHRLRPTAPFSRRQGRQFLSDLMKATLRQLEKDNWKMTGRQARDIGWSAGKQWFMDEKLVDPIQVGPCPFWERVKNGVCRQAVPVAWAIAHSGQYPVRLFDAFVQQISAIHGDLNLQHCTNLLWSMAVCGYYPGQPFLQAMAQLTGHLIHTDPSLVIPQAVADLVHDGRYAESLTQLCQIWSLGRLNLASGHEVLVHQCTRWAYNNLTAFSPEELLTFAMGLAMLESLGAEDMRALAEAFYSVTRKSLLEVYIDQFIALSLLFPLEYRSMLHETAFGSAAAASILTAHHDRQAQIAIQMKNNKFLQLISHQLDKVAEGKYEIGVLTEDRNLALEILVHGVTEDYSVIPVYPMSRCRNEPEIELGEVRIARKLIEAQGIKFGGFLEWITPRDDTASESDENEQTHTI